MPHPFVIFALPRSRSFWLSRFLSANGIACEHDQSRYARSIDDIRRWFQQKNIGLVDTGAAPFWRFLLREVPNLRVGVLHRNVQDVHESWMKAAPGSNSTAVKTTLERLEKKLFQIAKRVPDCEFIESENLSSEIFCRRLFENFTETACPFGHWVSLSEQNLQVNLPALCEYAKIFFPVLKKICGHLRQEQLLAFSRKPAQDLSGVSLQWETLRQLYLDGTRLFENHMLTTEQDIEDFKKKNWVLMDKLNKLGILRVATARCNGRLVGYRLTIVSPTLDLPGIYAAEHTTLFADPQFPGVGAKLAKFTDEELRNAGVVRFIARAGVRGSGERLSTLYKRQGYKEFGTLYEQGIQ